MKVSIPRWFDSSIDVDCCSRCHGCFNSTMVRFKHLTDHVIAVARKCRFNSTMVRFKHHCRRSSVDGSRAGFNSTMVRFKLCLSTVIASLTDVVSIPRWFDSSQHIDRSTSSKVCRVSIPRWFDSSLVQSNDSEAHEQLVSIPRWFDSSSYRCKLQSLQIHVFQFHDGSIQAD